MPCPRHRPRHLAPCRPSAPPCRRRRRRCPMLFRRACRGIPWAGPYTLPLRRGLGVAAGGSLTLGLAAEMETLEELGGFLVRLLDRVVEPPARRVVEPVLDFVHRV